MDLPVCIILLSYVNAFEIPGGYCQCLFIFSATEEAESRLAAMKSTFENRISNLTKEVSDNSQQVKTLTAEVAEKTKQVEQLSTERAELQEKV